MERSRSGWRGHGKRSGIWNGPAAVGGDGVFELAGDFQRGDANELFSADDAAGNNWQHRRGGSIQCSNDQPTRLIVADAMEFMGGKSVVEIIPECDE